MDEQVRQQAKAKLGGLIAKVLEDGVIDAGERESLQGFFRDALLTVSDVKAVYLDSVGALQAEVLADGVVTAEEARRCKLVVEQLRIPLRMLPPEMVAIVTGQKP
ncbi:MAG: hypothetical protein SF187_02755 [Deltaproteobacteria bacterium]|nr:hypothetical protein [Deltaproteobacteria bacterium]